MDDEGRRRLGWWAAGGVAALLLWSPWNNDGREPPPPAPLNYTDSGYTGPPSVYDPGHSGYENPAPGDDGTADCVPGQGPVYVGPSDPNGLDGDGDGIGCE